MNRAIIILLLLISHWRSSAQLEGILKVGFNIGTVNQEWYGWGGDSIKLGKPLIRPVISVGAQYWLSKSFFLQQELMFQMKGQGTSTPDVWSIFRTANPDVLRFMSFPLSFNGKVLPHIFLGISIQPSLYLSGTENFYAKTPWKGWIWGSSVSLKYIKDTWEFGMEYDHDFSLYFCPGCDIRYYTLRFYGAYHFKEE